MSFVRSSVFLGLAWLLSSACSGGDDPAGGTAGGSTAATDPVCDQTCQDYLVSLGLVDTVTLAYNQSIAGTPVGTEDVTAPCPLGGSVHITGTTNYSPDNGISNVDLTYAFENCKNSDSLYQLTFTGSVRQYGTFKNDGYTALTYTSESLTVAGDLEMFDGPAVSDTGSLSVTVQGDDEDESLDGQFEGRSFSSDDAFSGAFGPGAEDGSGGSDGGPTAGSGGTVVTGGVGCPSIYDGSYFGQFVYTSETGDPPVSSTSSFNLTVELECLSVTSAAATLVVTHATASHAYFGCGVGGCTPKTGSVALLPAEPPANPSNPSGTGHGLIVYFPNGVVLGTENSAGALTVTSDGRTLSSALDSTRTWSAVSLSQATVFPNDASTVKSQDSWTLTKSAL